MVGWWCWWKRRGRRPHFSPKWWYCKFCCQPHRSSLDHKSACLVPKKQSPATRTNLHIIHRYLLSAADFTKTCDWISDLLRNIRYLSAAHMFPSNRFCFSECTWIGTPFPVVCTHFAVSSVNIFGQNRITRKNIEKTYISIDIYKHEIYLAAIWHAKIHGFPRLKLSHGWHVFVFHSQALGAPSQRTPVCLASGA